MNFTTQNIKDMNETNARSFTGLLLLADAINRAGSTNRDGIRRSLRHTDIPGNRLIIPWQGVRFDSNGQNILTNALLAQIIKLEIQNSLTAICCGNQGRMASAKMG